MAERECDFKLSELPVLIDKENVLPDGPRLDELANALEGYTQPKKRFTLTTDYQVPLPQPPRTPYVLISVIPLSNMTRNL